MLPTKIRYISIINICTCLVFWLDQRLEHYWGFKHFILYRIVKVNLQTRKGQKEWVSNCLTPRGQFFKNIKARTNCISMSWCPLRTRPTRLVGFSVLAHSLQVNMTLTQTHYPDAEQIQSLILLLYTACLAANTSYITLWLTWPQLKPTIY